MLLALLAAVAVFLAVSSVLLWLGRAGVASTDGRLSQLKMAHPAAYEAPFAERVFLPIVGGLAHLLMEMLPTAFVRRVSAQLAAAGSPMSAPAFFTIVTVTGILFPAAGVILYSLSVSGPVPAVAFLLALIFLVLGTAGPFYFLHRSVRRRKQAIWRSLPDAFDLITVCVEAGLGLDAALRQVAEKLKGPLADEISQMLREVGIGRSRREALEDMGERVDVKELRTFVNAVIQAEQLGTSLGRVLRAQGVTLRIQRRQRAEELARRAPVKLVFPLVLFIMPTFFILTLGPIVVRAINYLNG